jgi:hypothetical protein
LKLLNILGNRAGLKEKGGGMQNPGIGNKMQSSYLYSHLDLPMAKI